jgi:hypothetical protein
MEKKKGNAAQTKSWTKGGIKGKEIWMEANRSNTDLTNPSRKPPRKVLPRSIHTHWCVCVLLLLRGYYKLSRRLVTSNIQFLVLGKKKKNHRIPTEFGSSILSIPIGNYNNNNGKRELCNTCVKPPLSKISSVSMGYNTHTERHNLAMDIYIFLQKI